MKFHVILHHQKLQAEYTFLTKKKRKKKSIRYCYYSQSTYINKGMVNKHSRKLNRLVPNIQKTDIHFSFDNHDMISPCPLLTFFSECLARSHQFVFISCGLFCSLSVPSPNFYEAFLTPLFTFFLTTPPLHSSELSLTWYVLRVLLGRIKGCFSFPLFPTFFLLVLLLFTEVIIILFFSH